MIFLAGRSACITWLVCMRLLTSADFVPFDWDVVTASKRRRLPHVTMPGAIYFVTFRLGDALPQEVSKKWSDERAVWLASNPPPWSDLIEKEYHRRFTMRMERYLDAGHGDCILRGEVFRREIAASLHHDDGKTYELGDFVIMPNHVHVLLKPLVPASASVLIGPVKGASSRRINQVLGMVGPLWMDESFDHIVRSLESLVRFQSYLANNPIKAGLSESEFTYERRWDVQVG